MNKQIKIWKDKEKKNARIKCTVFITCFAILDSTLTLDLHLNHYGNLKAGKICPIARYYFSKGKKDEAYKHQVKHVEYTYDEGLMFRYVKETKYNPEGIQELYIADTWAYYRYWFYNDDSKKMEVYGYRKFAYDNQQENQEELPSGYMNLSQTENEDYSWKKLIKKS